MPDGPTPIPTPQAPPQPWDNIPGESLNHFNQFLTYLYLGPHRTLVDAYRIFSLRGDATEPTAAFSDTSSRFQWRHRAAAYDTWQALDRQRAREQAARDVAASQGARDAEAEWAERRSAHREQAWDMSQALLAKAKEMLSIAIIRKKVIPAGPNRPAEIHYQPAGWSLSTIPQFLEAADRLARMAAELPVTIQDVNRRSEESGHDESLFARTDGILEDVLPIGVVPAMPENVSSLPVISIQRESHARGVTQPPRLRPAAARGPGRPPKKKP